MVIVHLQPQEWRYEVIVFTGIFPFHPQQVLCVASVFVACGVQCKQMCNDCESVCIVVMYIHSSYMTLIGVHEMHSSTVIPLFLDPVSDRRVHVHVHISHVISAMCVLHRHSSGLLGKWRKWSFTMCNLHCFNTKCTCMSSLMGNYMYMCIVLCIF